MLSLSPTNRKIHSFRHIFLTGLLLFTSAISLDAQRDVANAGGSWQQFDSEDKMTAAHKVRFELLSTSYLRSVRSVQSRIDIFCENGKYKSGEFTPGVVLGPPDHPGFWGQPKMEVKVRIDNSHGNRGWNWNGTVLSMDKDTIRELIGSQIFNIEFLARGGPEIAEFSPGGLDLDAVGHACELKPKKP